MKNQICITDCKEVLHIHTHTHTQTHTHTHTCVYVFVNVFVLVYDVYINSLTTYI